MFAVAPLGVAAGHTVVISSLLSSTSITGAVSATDSAGNSYVLACDVNDGSAGDPVVTLIALNVKAVGAGGTITFTHPSSGETHVAVDEYAGVTAIDTSAGTSATGSAFSSGATPVTSQANELLIGVLGTESGSSPAWLTGWTALPALAVSTDYLGTAYRIVTTTGSYAASGASGGQWMAGIVTLKAGAVAATAPSSPQGVSATAGNTTVQLNWTPPTSTGGSAITGYNIYRGTAPNAEASTPIASNLTTTSYTDTALTNGTTYYYKITALNNIGPSAPSAETSATPQAAPTVPSPPQGVSATAGNTTGATELDPADIHRRLRHHRLQHLPRHRPQRRGEHTHRQQPHHHQLHRHHPDQRNHLLLQDHRTQQHRPLSTISRNHGHPPSRTYRFKLCQARGIDNGRSHNDHEIK